MTPETTGHGDVITRQEQMWFPWVPSFLQSLHMRLVGIVGRRMVVSLSVLGSRKDLDFQVNVNAPQEALL